MTTPVQTLTDQQHVAILTSYVSRLTVADVEKLAEAVKAATHASQNLGMSSQLESAERLVDAASGAIGRMIEHDKQLISRIIAQAV